MTVLAGLLPNPASTVAALSIAFSLFTNMFFVYLSQSLACSTRCGPPSCPHRVLGLRV